MKHQGKYLLGTAKEIGGYIASILCENDAAGKCFTFPKFSFAVATDRIYSDDLETIGMNSDGWYGVQSIETPFTQGGSEVTTLIGDYWGGGTAVAGSLWLDELDYIPTTADCIATIMRKAIEMQETVTDDTVYIVEFENEDK